MSLKEQIDADIKKAMLGQKKDELRALRGIKSLILLAETEKGTGIDVATEMQLLTKATKQRKDSLEIFNKQGRDDLAKIERDELEVINRYLPKQLSETELIEEITAIIAEIGAQGSKDMGKVMGALTKKLAGKADGKTMAELVKKILNS